MQVKEIVKKTVDSLPDNVSFEEVIEALYIQSKFQKSEEQIRKGEGLSHEQVCERMSEWLD